MVLGGQSREVIMLTDDNDHLPQPAASGQELAFAFPTERSPKGPVHFESCRTPYGCLSAIAAGQQADRLSRQFIAKLPLIYQSV